MPKKRINPELQHYTEAMESFPYFLEHIWKHSYEKYVNAPHTQEWASAIQTHEHVAFLAARNHLKSSTIYAYIAWEIFRSKHRDLEILYLSYKSDLAAYHTRKLKELMKKNPHFDQIRDMTPAESIIKTTEDNIHKVTIEPDGILAFKRGRHPDIVICDDILADPANATNPAILQKIERVFMEDVMSLPKQPHGKLILIGTPQDRKDLFFTIRENSTRFHWSMNPAILDQANKTVLWEEMFPFEKLQAIREEIGEKAFNKEYLCAPVRGEEGFFTMDKVLAHVNPNLPQKTSYTGKHLVFAGWDLGKKRHPSHVAVFEMDTEHKVIRQLRSLWMDQTDYSDQITVIKNLIESLKIDTVYFDATRGELEMEMERKNLPRQLLPITFKNKTKHAMATQFEKAMNDPEWKLELIADQRQTDQILQVDNNLEALETQQGHGDSFWSISMAMWACEKEFSRSTSGGGELI